MLLHGNRCSQVILGTFDLIDSHHATLVLSHDLFELLVGVEHITIRIDGWSLVLTRLHVIEVRIDDFSLISSLLRFIMLLMLLSILILLSLGRRGPWVWPGYNILHRLLLLHKNISGEVLELLHLPFAIVIDFFFSRFSGFPVILLLTLLLRLFRFNGSLLRG